MKIMIIGIKPSSAVDGIIKGVIPHLKKHTILYRPIHPKRPDQADLDWFEENYKKVDVIDFQYWKTAEMLREKFPESKKVPSMLTHHNPYDIFERDWKDYTKVYVMNKTMQAELSTGGVNNTYMASGIDLNYWKFNPDYNEDGYVLMVAQRIEGKKGILPVAKVCRKLGIKMYLVGDISDTNYYNDVIQEGVVMLRNIPVSELSEVYKKAALHVCNSQDRFESGTLPILESMATGVPVLSRSVGHVPDILQYDDAIFINEGQPEDEESLERCIKYLMDNPDVRKDLRNKAWEVVKQYSIVRRAKKYSREYQTIGRRNKLVSVVVPAYSHPEVLEKNLLSLLAQTYEPFEVLVADDGTPGEELLAVVDTLKPEFDKKSITLGYYNTNYNGYGLAKARNLGTIEADGEIMVYLDQRLEADPNMVYELVRNVDKKKWVYANKQNGKKSFVENASCIYRDDIISIGMFPEWVDEYGGMTQALNYLTKTNGIDTVFVETARCSQIAGSRNKNEKRNSIIKMKDKLWKLNMY